MARAHKLRILLVEDDPFIGFDLADELAEAGLEVVGSAVRAADGLALLARHTFDAAVLDIHLGRDTSEQVALELVRRGIPFISVSGYSDEQRPAVFRAAPFLTKPVNVPALIAELERLVSR